MSISRVLPTAVLICSLSLVGAAQDHAPQDELDAPLSVETVGLEPTAAKTGDLITATYRVRFKDLLDSGKEIIVLEDRMDPEKLSVAPFEAVGLEVRKRQADDEQVWDFVYAFRILKPEKGIHVLGRVTFYWLIREVGQSLEEAKVLQSETDPLQFRYVTTLTEEPVLNIRDSIELGNFARRAAIFRTVAWTVAPLPLVLWATAFAMSWRRRTPVVAVNRSRDEDKDLVDTVIAAPPTIGRARRNLRRQLGALAEAAPSVDGADLMELERGLVIALRDYLKVEVPQLNPGDTPKEIQRHVHTSFGDEPRGDILRALAGRLVGYQHDLERGTRLAMSDPAGEAREIESLLRELRPHARAIGRLRKSLGRA